METISEPSIKRPINADGLPASVKTLKEDFNTLARDAGDVAHSGIAAAREHVRHSVDAVKEKGHDATDYITNSVKAQPLAAIGIAAGVGFVIGMILCGRK